MTDASRDDEPGRFTGMTTNERLFTAGLLDAWDAAALKRDRERMVEILAKVTDAGFTRDSAIRTVDAVLTDPGKFGF